eukprot:GDKI01003413.1.p1 GENE.GDKI01003413.1~~GDKI01003413.1.p1  ORF type:complete len:455 (-),score=193.42 GDKI01003413.1:443-1807(-)
MQMMGYSTADCCNYWRKGGYTLHAGDYRWAYVRQRIGEVPFQLLNFVFVAFIQNYLLMLLAAGPAYVAWLARRRESTAELNTCDYCAAALLLLCFVGETVADEQQWAFQSNKRNAAVKSRFEKSDADYRRGFLTSGLFRYSRHPNFFCEISLWWCVYGFALSVLFSSGAVTSKCPFFFVCRMFHWSCVGAAFLTLLFQGSTALTEHITLEKYPQYAVYQEVTSRLIPAVSDSWPAEEEEKRKKEEEEAKNRPDEKILDEFEDAVATYLNGKDKASVIIEKAKKLLGEKEYKSFAPCERVASAALKHCKEAGYTEDDQVKEVVNRLKELIEYVFAAKVPKQKFAFIKQSVKTAFHLGLPRLNKASALIEVFFDQIYMEEVIEDAYFLKWFEDHNDETEGREKALFQLMAWFQTLQEDDEEEEEEEADEESEGSDVEKLIPQRGAMGRVMPVATRR